MVVAVLADPLANLLHTSILTLFHCTQPGGSAVDHFLHPSLSIGWTIQPKLTLTDRRRCSLLALIIFFLLAS